MVEMTREAFEEAVSDALDLVPPELTAQMQNVVVLVEDDAPAEDPDVAVAVMIQSAPGTDRGEIAGGALGGPIAKAVMEAVIDP